MRYGAYFVYVIGSADCPVKVGWASNMAKRLEALQVGNPDRLIVHHRLGFPPDITPTIEAAAHVALADSHRRGEWFNVGADEARDTVLRVAEPIIIAWKGPVQRSSDQIQELFATHHLSAWTPEAVNFYRTKLNGGAADKVTLAQANAYIVQRAGVVAYNVFRQAVIERKDLIAVFLHEPAALRRAKDSLAAAICALGDWYGLRREQMLLDQIA